jgi:RNA polymerase sigma-70 factor, ECF subfamily
VVTHDAKNDGERARRFRDAALPCLDDAYRLARFLMRNQADAEDAVQECYLRALQHFDSFCGPAIKPWLLAILRNVCYSEFARRGRREQPTDLSDCQDTIEPVWQQPLTTPDAAMLSSQDGAAIRQLLTALPAPFREAIVMRELNDMTYQEIAAAMEVPVGTVMSRLARARAMLLARWKAEHRAPQSDKPAAKFTPILKYSRPTMFGD